MKKNIVFLFCFIVFIFPTRAENTIFNSFCEYTLENECKVFVLEDFSIPHVRIELSIKSGFSSQRKDEAGFFSLLLEILSAQIKNADSEKILSNFSSVCSSDSMRFIIETSPFFLEKALYLLKTQIFDESLTDFYTSEKLSQMKTSVMQYVQSPEGFINSSIDSRVFSEAPWKHDSGVYPAIFSKAQVPEVRTSLNKIRENHFGGKNTGIFISGAAKKEDVLTVCKEIFSQIRQNTKQQDDSKIDVENQQKKFVLHDSRFSDELSQIIVQYKTSNITECDVISKMLNDNNSSFKTKAFLDEKLAIPGTEYINAESAHKNSVSRIIFQVLSQNSKTTPCAQSEIFLDYTKNAFSYATKQEFENAKDSLIQEFRKIFCDSTTFMDYLAQFWAVKDFNESQEKSLSLKEEFLNETQRIKSVSFSSAKKNYENTEPFIFVLINSKNFKKHKKEFLDSGYEEINFKNASWYTNSLYKNALNEIQNEKKSLETKEKKLPQDFYKEFESENKKNTSFFTLKNSIPVTFKENKDSDSAVFLLGIKCGKLSSENNALFNSVMVNLLCENIRLEAEKNLQQKKIISKPEISCKTDLAFSSILIQTKPEELGKIITIAFSSLIDSEILPYTVDRIVYSVQTQKRLFSQSTQNQMTSKAVEAIFKSKRYKNAFSTDEEIFQISFNDILKAYPEFLNASLFNITVSGNFNSEKINDTLNKTFSLLLKQNNTKNNKFSFEKPSFPEKNRKSVKINHYFYTDVKKEDAGPMPKTLIPTKNFNDPVEFFIKSPDANTKDFTIFNCLCDFLNERMKIFAVENEIAENVRCENATIFFESSYFIFSGVFHTEKALETYRSEISKLKEELKESENTVLLQIINNWILQNISKTKTSSGTAELLSSGQILYKNPLKYLDDYKIISESTKEDFLFTLENFFPETPNFTIVSKDSKK